MCGRLLFLAVVVCAGLESASASDGNVLQALTRPTLEVALNPMIDGRVAEILVTEGDLVTSGDTIVKLEDDVQAARVKLAERSAAQTGNVEKARRHVERMQERLDRLTAARKGSIPSWEIKEAEYQLRLAQAELKVAEDALGVESGKLALEQRVLSQFTIKAPFDGEVVELTVDRGATVKRTDNLITIANLSQLEAIAYVPEHLIEKLRKGQVYNAELQKPANRNVQAKLIYIDRRLEPASRTFRAVFEIENNDKSIPSGTEVAIAIPDRTGQ